MHCDAARDKARIFCSLFSRLQEEAAFFANVQDVELPCSRRPLMYALQVRASMSVAGNAFSKRGLRRRTHIFDGVKT